MRAEFMCFINQNKVKFISIPVVIIVFIENLRQTAIGNKINKLVNAKIFKCCFPVVFYGRWIDDENFVLSRPFSIKNFLAIIVAITVLPRPTTSARKSHRNAVAFDNLLPQHPFGNHISYTLPAYQMDCYRLLP